MRQRTRQYGNNRIKAELVIGLETKANEISVPGKRGEFLLGYPNSKKRGLCNLKMSEAYKAFLNIRFFQMIKQKYFVLTALFSNTF